MKNIPATPVINKLDIYIYTVCVCPKMTTKDKNIQENTNHNSAQENSYLTKHNIMTVIKIEIYTNMYKRKQPVL